jgi:quercetin dioxygenase-like cupin family protein
MEEQVRLERWPEGHKPAEKEIRDIMQDEGLKPYRWSNGPGDVYSAHSHGYHKVIFVTDGSITFGLPDRGEEIELHVGDRLDLPSGVTHDAVVGPEGVVCLEAHREV